MSLDIDFNIAISLEDIENETPIKVENKDEFYYLKDRHGNSAFAKGYDFIYGLTFYGSMRNPLKMLDELVRAFNLMFIGEETIDRLMYEPERFDEEELFRFNMLLNDYCFVEDRVIVPKRRNGHYIHQKFYDFDDVHESWNYTKNQTPSTGELPF